MTSMVSKISTPLGVALFFCVVLLLVAQTQPQVVPVHHLQEMTVLDLLTTLALISALVERALEVLITLWRVPQERTLQQALTATSNVPGDGQAASESSRARETDLQNFKTETQRIALAFSLMLGVVMSAVGVRSLATLFDLSHLEGVQGIVFSIVDVLLTGVVIAGGSDAIHKVVSVFTTFMDQSKTRMQSTS